MGTTLYLKKCRPVGFFFSLSKLNSGTSFQYSAFNKNTSLLGGALIVAHAFIGGN